MHTFSFPFIWTMTTRSQGNHCERAADALFRPSPFTKLLKPASLHFWNIHISAFSAKQRAHWYTCSLLISFEVAHFTKTEDLNGKKQDCWARFLSHLFLTKNGRLRLMIPFTKKKLNRTITLMNTLLSAVYRKQIEVMFAEELLHSVVSVLSKFPFMGIYRCVHVSQYSGSSQCTVFCRSWKNVKEVCISHARGRQQNNDFHSRRKRKREIFSSCRANSTSNTKQILKQWSENSPKYGLKVCIWKPGSSQGLAGLCNENGIHGVLEASDFDSIHNMSPFFRELLDRLCGLTKISETLSALTKYVDMVKFLF